MTSWQDARRYIHSHYSADDLDEDLVRLVFNTNNLRSQIVFVAHERSSAGQEWIRVNSPIGRVSELDFVRAGRLLADKIVGGLIILDDLVVVTNCVPLENLDANELTMPLERVMSIADELEAQLLNGADQY